MESKKVDMYRMKNVMYVFILMCMFPILYVSISFWYNDSLYIPDIGIADKQILKPEQLTLLATDFESNEKGEFVSVSNDPWFSVSSQFGVRTIVVDVDEISRDSTAQIFYYKKNGEFDAKKNVACKIRAGKNYAQLPDNEYTELRLDLVEKTGISLKIKSVTLYGKRVVPILSVAIFCSTCLITAFMLYIWMFRREKMKQKLSALCIRLGSYHFYMLFLLLLLGVTILVVYGKIIVSGNEYVYYDIGGGDGPESWIPAMFSYINKIRTGELRQWTFNNGLGTSTVVVWEFLFNPFTLLVFFVGIVFGVQTLNGMLLLAQVINVIVCGLLCYKYLNFFEGSHRSKAVASYICALCGFMTLYASHYGHSDFLFYLLIILILVEEILEKEKHGTYYFYFSIVCALMFGGYVYMGYMIGLFTGIYTLFRVAQKYELKEWKIAIKKIGSILLFAILGIMLSLPTLLPLVNDLLVNSTRISSDIGMLQKIKEFLLTPYSVDAIKTTMLRMISNNLQGAGNDYFGTTDVTNDYYSAPTLFFSVFMFFFIITYYTSLKKYIQKKSKYLVQLVIGIAVAFLLFNKLGSAIFNALVMPFGRYSYLLMPIFAIVAMRSMDQLKNMSGKEKGIALVTLFLTAFVIISQWKSMSGVENIGVYLKKLILVDTVVVIMSAIVLICNKRWKKNAIYFVFSGLIFINVTVDTYITVNDRAFCLFSSDLIDVDDIYTQDALEYIKKIDTSMYRVEKNYYDLIYFNDAYFQNYRGVATYNSTLNGKIKDFYRTYYDQAVNFYGPDSFWYSFLNVSNNIVQNSLLGVRYILSDGRAYPNSGYEQIYENEKIKVYKSIPAKSFGTFYTYAISSSEVQNLNLIEKQNVLEGAVVLEDKMAEQSQQRITYETLADMLMQKEVFRLQTETSLSAGKKQEYNLTDEELRVHSKKQSAKIIISFDEDVTGECTNSFLQFTTDINYDNYIKIYFDTGTGFKEWMPYYHRGNVDGSMSSASVLLPDDIKRVKFTCSAPDMLLKDIKVVAMEKQILPDETIPEVEIIDDSHLYGKIMAQDNGYLFLPIPYENGWSIIVDGQKTEILKADSGFCAVKLSEGKHEFYMSYSYPGGKIGLVIAAIDGIILVMCLLYLRRNERKKI